MNFSKKTLMIAAGAAMLTLFACSKHNPDSVLNPESDEYDKALAVDADGNGIADGLEPYMEECNGDAKCAEQKARDAKHAAEASSSLTSSADDLSSAETPSSANPVSSTPASSTGLSSVIPGSSVVGSSGGTSSLSSATSSGTVSSSSVPPTSSSSSLPDGTYKVTVVGGIIVGTGLTSGNFAKDTTIKLALAPFSGGLDLCKNGWVTADVQGDFITDTITFIMPGKNVTFTGGSRACPDTLTDGRDGETYRYETIGGKKWLEANIRFNTSGDLDYCYSDSEASCDTLGRLYQYESAIVACPTGWRLPKIQEIADNVDALNLKAVGRRDENGGYNYINDLNNISYWFDSTGIEASGVTISGKGCDYNTEECELIFTNTTSGWGVGSIDLTKSYPVRCIMK